MEAQFLCQEDPLEKEMATHSSILPGESHGQSDLVSYSPQSRRVGHDWSDLACTHENISCKSNKQANMSLVLMWKEKYEDINVCILTFKIIYYFYEIYFLDMF